MTVLPGHCAHELTFNALIIFLNVLANSEQQVFLVINEKTDASQRP